MRKKRKTVWAFLDGKKLVDVVQAALDNNMMVDDLKAKLIAENPGHEVTFTSAAKQSGKRENRPGVMPLGLWKRSFPIAKCSSMGRSAVTGYGGNRVFRTLKDTCFQERPTDGGRFWIKTGSL